MEFPADKKKVLKLVMELQFILLLRNGKPEPAVVWKMEFATANAIVFIISLTVISAGIPTAIVITLGTTYIC